MKKEEGWRVSPVKTTEIKYYIVTDQDDANLLTNNNDSVEQAEVCVNLHCIFHDDYHFKNLVGLINSEELFPIPTGDLFPKQYSFIFQLNNAHDVSFEGEEANLTLA